MKSISKPIRIAYVIDSLSKGGAQTALVYLVHYLATKGYEQRIYCLNDIIHLDYKKSLLECNVDIKRIGKKQIVIGIGLIRILAEWLIWKPTIVFTLLFYSDIIGRTLAKITNRPIIISSIRARNIDKKPWQFYLDKLTAPWAQKVVFNSKGVIPFAQQYEGIQTQQVIYIPNGVKTNFNKVNFNPLAKRKELGITTDTFIIGSIGRLSPQKGFLYLFQAIEIVQQQFPNCLVVIIGSGILLKTLQTLLAEINLSNKVRFLGERTDISELLLCMDVYVQSSLFEGMPNALMEAMALGKPVIATAVDGALELVEEGKTGWLVEPKNSTMLAEKISYVLKHPNQAKEVGIAAAKKMAHNFSIERMGESYNTLFRELVSDKLIT
jgi:glycosyltransferase involved in cell wall biosynthesis